jgi:16S rRNA (uracil1498-N3)-methyltransferase
LRTHRVHIQQDLQPGLEIVLEGAAAHYLGRVLRVAAGQGVILFNGDGQEYMAEVRRADRRALVVAIEGKRPGLAEPPCKLIVAQALSRGERLDFTLQKCTELGASSFQLLIAERSELKLRDDKLSRRLEHWQSVVVSACEQCGRSRVPPVLAPLSVAQWLERATSACRMVLDPVAPAPLASLRAPDDMELAVGPEGGFSDGELKLMEQQGVRRFNLGPRILRTETAGPAAVAVLQCLHGDLGPGGYEAGAD